MEDVYVDCCRVPRTKTSPAPRSQQAKPTKIRNNNNNNGLPYDTTPLYGLTPPRFLFPSITTHEPASPELRGPAQQDAQRQVEHEQLGTNET